MNHFEQILFFASKNNLQNFRYCWSECYTIEIIYDLQYYLTLIFKLFGKQYSPGIFYSPGNGSPGNSNFIPGDPRGGNTSTHGYPILPIENSGVLCEN